MVYIIKKDGTKEEFDASKIKRAVNKSAGRVMYRLILSANMQLTGRKRCQKSEKAES